MSSQKTLAYIVIAIVIGVVSWWGTSWLVPAQLTTPVFKVAESIQTIAPTSEPTPQPTPSFQTLKLLFGGDLMFDRNIRLKMAQHGVGFPLAPLQSLFSEHDVVIANLEGPVTPWPSKSVGSVVGSPANFAFTFQPEIVPMLAASNMRIVNLGNNHITNFGVAGVTSTKEYLQAGGVQFFGNTGTEATSEDRMLVTTIGGRSLAFVNLNQFTPQGFESSLEDVKVATLAAEIVIVMPHWGEEYTPVANRVIQNQAAALIEAGADVIVGGHPHVIQNVEEIAGKRVYYSLGNMVFDQYFSPETQRGWLVGLEITPSGEWLFTEYDIKLEPSGQTKLIKPVLLDTP